MFLLKIPIVGLFLIVRWAVRQPPEPAHNLTDERISLVTDLPGDENGLLELIDSSARRNVRKARRSGFLATTDASRLPSVAEIHRDNIQALDGRAKELSFFAAVPRHFEAGREFDVHVALLEDEVVAGLLVFFFNGTAEYFTPAVHHDHRSEQPLALLRSEIFDYINEGEELVEQPFQRLIAARRLSAYKWSGFWRCMDTFKDKITYDRMEAKGDCPWKVWTGDKGS